MSDRPDRGRDGLLKRSGALPPTLGYAGVFRFTWRTLRANAALLLFVAVVTAVCELAGSALIIWGLADPAAKHAGLAATLGSTAVISGAVTGVGSIGESLLLTVLGVLVGAWSSATVIRLLIIHVHEHRRPRAADLAGGWRFVGWVVLAGLAIAFVQLGLNRVVIPLNVVLGVLLGVVTVFVDVSIVEARGNALTAFGQSWRLVRQAGFWRTLGTFLLFILCLGVVLSVIFMPVVAAFSGKAASSTFTVATSAIGFLFSPLIAVFTTVMYFLARGERDAMESATAAPSSLGGT